MIRYVVISFVLLCASAHADLCEETDQIADAVLYMPEVNAFREKMAEVMDSTNIHDSIHADLIDKYSDISEYREEIHDMYVNLLEADFTCDEIEAASNFVRSPYGNDFFRKLYPMYTTIGVRYVDIFQKRMEELADAVEIRNQKIIEYLPEIKELDAPLMIPVVVATKSLAAGTKISNKNVAIRQIPSRYYSSYYVKPDDYEKKLKNRVLSKNISNGDPVLEMFVK